MSNSAENDSKSIPPNTIVLSEREIELKRSFEHIGDGSLVRIFEGAITVLSDPSNKDKYAQAANSIRGITNKLLRHIGRDSKALLAEFSTEDKKGKVIQEIRALFEKVIDFIPHDPSLSKKQLCEAARQKFEELLSDMVTGKVTMKQNLKTLFGTEAQLKTLTPQIKSSLDMALKIWNECHKYFTDISHHGTAATHERFMENWYRIQDCWWSACCIFIDASPEIDDVIKKGPPK